MRSNAWFLDLLITIYQVQWLRSAFGSSFGVLFDGHGIL